jgi:uncharacterized protein (TIGR03435 family)
MTAADIFSAVREHLGMRLEPTQAVTGILKIDRVEKAPTQN